MPSLRLFPPRISIAIIRNRTSTPLQPAALGRVHPRIRIGADTRGGKRRISTLSPAPAPWQVTMMSRFWMTGRRSRGKEVGIQLRSCRWLSPRGGGKGKADGDTDSEELIRDSSSGNEGHNHGASDRHRAGTPLDSLPGTTTSLEDPFHIHTMTEVRVERHEI